MKDKYNIIEVDGKTLENKRPNADYSDIDTPFNFDIDNLEEAKNSNNEVMPYFKDFNEFDVWLNGEDKDKEED